VAEDAVNASVDMYGVVRNAVFGGMLTRTAAAKARHAVFLHYHGAVLYLPSASPAWNGARYVRPSGHMLLPEGRKEAVLGGWW
jgi:hypothetical protein